MKVILLMVAALFSLLSFADEAKDSEKPTTFKTWISVEEVSDDTEVAITLPGERKPVVDKRLGEQYEVPYFIARTNRFQIQVQLNRSQGYLIHPCRIEVETLTEYDRKYVCRARDPERTQVTLRVYTNLHGGERQLAAKSKRR